jgi:hypothetical protein
MWRGEVKLVPLESGGNPAVRWSLSNAGRAVFLSDDRELLANSTDAMGETALTIRDVRTGRELRTLTHARGYHVRTSGDGRWVVFGTSRTESSLMHVIDWTPGSPMPHDLQGAGKNAALSQDGTWLAIGRGTQIGLVRAKDGEMVAILETSRCGNYAPDLAFSPDGTQLGVCWENGMLTIWDLATLRRELAARGLDW